MHSPRFLSEKYRTSYPVKKGVSVYEGNVKFYTFLSKSSKSIGHESYLDKFIPDWYLICIVSSPIEFRADDNTYCLH